MENKKFRQIMLVIWGMIFCFNLFISLIVPEPDAVNWIMVGVPLGVIVMMLLNNSLLNIQEKLINLLVNVNKKYVSLFDEITSKKEKVKRRTTK